MEKIESLLPHREPFLFLDDIICATPEEIIGSKTFHEDSFREEFSPVKIVPAGVLLEALAQCGGAGAGARKLGFATGTDLFALTKIEAATFFQAVEIPVTIRIVITNIKLSHTLIKQSGTAYVEEVAVTTASWICMRMK
jgi:3-hydroxyacyl-[acyl-carrier-protein] dehydratase